MRKSRVPANEHTEEVAAPAIPSKVVVIKQEPVAEAEAESELKVLSVSTTHPPATGGDDSDIEVVSVTIIKPFKRARLR